MTTEEKAKAYDEALKQAQYWLNAPQVIEDWNYTVKDVIPNIFPDLKESEDERIRRHLIDIVETYWGTTNDPGKAADLAWLEKQKENTDRAILIGKAKSEKQVVLLAESNGDENIYWDTKSEEDAVSLLEKGLKFFEKQKEQKSAEHCDGICCGDDRFKIIGEARKDIIEKTNIAENEFSMELPLLDGILTRVWQVGWLNKKQKPAEWSEEDKKMIDDIIYCLPRMAMGNIEMLPSVAEQYAQRLKSLRPQPHWKPSEEQMYILEWLTNNVLDDGVVGKKAKEELNILIEQLKSL